MIEKLLNWFNKSESEMKKKYLKSEWTSVQIQDEQKMDLSLYGFFLFFTSKDLFREQTMIELKQENSCSERLF